ncbi:MAG: cytidine deaminase [Ignisphaera sp.]
MEIPIDKLIKDVEKVLPNSYAPYSGIHVTAAVLTSKGNVYLGVNVENASYGLTICAERVAIASAITNGEKEFTAIVIASNTDEPLPPCGACRQVLAEFVNNDIVIISHSVNTKKSKIWRLSELLPHTFKSIYIKKPSNHKPI